MRLVSEVLRLKHATKLSHRQIARALRIGIGTVTNYLAAAERAGLLSLLKTRFEPHERERQPVNDLGGLIAPHHVLPQASESNSLRRQQSR